MAQYCALTKSFLHLLSPIDRDLHQKLRKHLMTAHSQPTLLLILTPKENHDDTQTVRQYVCEVLKKQLGTELMRIPASQKRNSAFFKHIAQTTQHASVRINIKSPFMQMADPSSQPEGKKS